MAQRFPVIPLNQPLRIYDFTVRQLVALAFMSFVMLMLVTQVDKTWILAGLPARFLLSVIGFSCAIVVVRMSDVRPMIWWKRQLLYYGKPIPVRLPDVHWSDKPDSPTKLLLNNNSRVCLKVRKEEFEALEEDRKQKILDSLVEFIEALDFTPGRSEDLQMLCSPMYSSPTMEDVDVYFVTSGELKHEMLKNKLLKAGLNVETVSQEETRSLLYGFLSPSHYEADEPIPPKVTHINDLVTLCSGGLDQQRHHVVADGRYIRSLYVKLLPRTTFFRNSEQVTRTKLQAVDLRILRFLRPVGNQKTAVEQISAYKHGKPGSN